VSNVLQTLRLNPENAEDLALAARILRQGGTVAFPTETVYGLGANALSDEAVEKIFVAKRRPHWDPLIVHVAERGQLAQVVAEVSPAAEALMGAFWPGPLTLLLPKTAAIPGIVTAGRPLVGVRIPAHPVAQALLRAAGVPIAAPSANTFGHTSPTTAEHVLADLDGRIDAVLDGGATEVGLESTVAEVGRFDVIVYRDGAVTDGRIEAVLGPEWYVHSYKADSDAGEESPSALPSPGVGIRHYAPRARLLLVGGPGADAGMRCRKLLELSLVETIDEHAGERVGVMLPDGWNASCADFLYRWGPWHQPEILAQRLYAGLRELDGRGASVIVCPVPESDGLANAMRDRLRKAAR
jgi:L-threonylcarbamoyladenylate synthase